MTSIPPRRTPAPAAPPAPPETPEGPSHVSAGAVNGGGNKGVGKLPEAVRYMVLCLGVMLGTEVAHQLLSAAAVLIDPSALRESTRDAAQASGEQVSDLMITVSVYSSVAMMLAFQLLIAGLLVFAVRAVAKRSSWAGNALRLLQFFSVFFVLRMITLFFMTPDSATVPVALYAVDGVLQIIVGAAAACALAYSMQDEVQKFARTRPPGQGGADSAATNHDSN
ncbi:hypothetical protein [uncultured Corynebacterium sp.]|uniref:hypothetical protein n=1 Tax=uncultured Corynebacterium sp. TaxID=159447 RepID=UPI0025954311|nr:hypothetical protein [uncultured Corynebacterium sp.]